ncbi:GNAT family N-acetyltransferase [Thiomicrospira pelophila]|uniref:GNAT family N-acetyltransferase n=1 Tax=Thiomicrospira pelophila TaxID=934 RepID=UPI0004A7064D|nr:GNAT family N-acetyltransferase [Thiomicrospira pelophila]
MRHRQLVVLSGDLSWRLNQLQKLETQPGLWFGETSLLPNFQVVDKLQNQLGQEIPSAIFCAESGIDADALGIAAGMIQAGGVLWLLIPPIDDWLHQPNPANQRFMSHPHTYHQAWCQFNDHLYTSLKSHGVWIMQDEPLNPGLKIDQPLNHPPLNGLSNDQQQALVAIKQVAFGHRKRPLIIEAARGRGKTTLLGESAARLLQQGKQHIVICTARFAQCELAFKRAAQVLGADYTKSGLKTQNQTLAFKAPGELIQHPIETDVLMLDEAAHLPIPVLEQLVQLYPRVVMATTQHGYEGSGRGFSLKFKPFLNQHFPGWHQTRLSQPIRWNTNDPLEKAINQALLLDIELNKLSSTDNLDPQHLTIDIRTRAPNQLSTDELSQVFSLLVEAHYQTSPADLQHWLSAPDLQLQLAYLPVVTNPQLVGVLLICNEGHLPNIEPNRRVKGHLVPQLLRRFSAQDDLLNLSSERAMRLAVHPQVQNLGIGSQLVLHWQQSSQAEFISTSFGVTQDLYHFWRKQGFESVHLGAKRDKASGTHNLVMLYSHPANELLDTGQQLFQTQLPHNLIELYNQLPASLIWNLLTENPAINHETLSVQLNAYLNEHAPYEAVSQQLWQWALNNPRCLLTQSEQVQSVWLDKIIRKRDWQTIAHQHKLAGRSAVETILRQTLTRYQAKSF